MVLLRIFHRIFLVLVEIAAEKIAAEKAVAEKIAVDNLFFIRNTFLVACMVKPKNQCTSHCPVRKSPWDASLFIPHSNTKSRRAFSIKLSPPFRL